MEQLVEGILTNFGIPLFWIWVIIPIVTGIIVSLVTGGLDAITPTSIKSIPILLSINFLLTLLVVASFPKYVTLLSLDGVLAFIANFFSAWLFYKLGGKIIIEKLFKKLVAKGNEKVDNG